MKRLLIVLGCILAAGIALVALAGFIRFNFTNGGDDLGSGDPGSSTGVQNLVVTIEPMPTRPSVEEFRIPGIQDLSASSNSGTGTVANPTAASPIPYGSTRLPAWMSAPQE